jgi:hypothetical protein
MIVQRPEFLVKSVRLLVNKWILCDDMAQMRIPYLRIRNPFFNDCIRRILLDRFGNVISNGSNMINKFHYGKYYDTAQSIATNGHNVNYDDSSFQGQTVSLSFFFFIIIIFYGYIKYIYF